MGGATRGESSDYKIRPKRSRPTPISFSALARYFTTRDKTQRASSSFPLESLESEEPKKRLPRTRDPFAPNKLRRVKDPYLDNVDEDGKKKLRRFPDSYLEFVHLIDRPTKLRRNSDPTTEEETPAGRKRLRRYGPEDLTESVQESDPPPYDPDADPPLPVNRLVRHDGETMATVRLMDPLTLYTEGGRQNGRRLPRHGELLPNYLDIFNGEGNPLPGDESAFISPPPPPPGAHVPIFRGATRMSRHVDPLHREQPMYMALDDDNRSSAA